MANAILAFKATIYTSEKQYDLSSVTWDNETLLPYFWAYLKKITNKTMHGDIIYWARIQSMKGLVYDVKKQNMVLL